jgi:hypothetical protein
LRWQAHAGGRRYRDPVLSDRPIEQRPQPGKGAIGLDEGTALNEPVNQVNDVAACDACDRPITPFSWDVAL